MNVPPITVRGKSPEPLRALAMAMGVKGKKHGTTTRRERTEHLRTRLPMWLSCHAIDDYDCEAICMTKLDAAAVSAAKKMKHSISRVDPMDYLIAPRDALQVAEIITAAYRPLLTAVQGVLGAGLCGCEDGTQKAAHKALQAAIDAAGKNDHAFRP